MNILSCLVNIYIFVKQIFLINIIVIKIIEFEVKLEL